MTEERIRQKSAGQRELQGMEPSQGFEERLSRALARADLDHAAPQPRRRSVGLGLSWAAALPVVAMGALAVHLTLLERWSDLSVEPLARNVEIHAILEPGELSWLDLELATAGHHPHEVMVSVQAPDSVSLRTSAAPALVAPVKSCDDSICEHRFRHTHDEDGAAPFSVGIRSPGRYRIRVEHSSSGKRLVEEFVVHARE